MTALASSWPGHKLPHNGSPQVGGGTSAQRSANTVWWTLGAQAQPHQGVVMLVVLAVLAVLTLLMVMVMSVMVGRRTGIHMPTSSTGIPINAPPRRRNTDGRVE